MDDLREEVSEKVNTLKNLLFSNESTQAITKITNSTLEYLCGIKPQLEIKSKGTLICLICHRDFSKDPEQNTATSQCMCMSFHRQCLYEEFKRISKMLEYSEIKDKITCKRCSQSFSPEFVEEALGQRFRVERAKFIEKENRRVKCEICKKEEKYSLCYERYCGHGFCESCFKDYLENIIKKNRGNIRDYVCPTKECPMSKLDINEVKQSISKEVWTIYDEFLGKIFDQKRENDTIYKCKNGQCSKFKVTPLESKDAEYECLPCESEKNKNEEEKKE